MTQNRSEADIKIELDFSVYNHESSINGKYMHIHDMKQRCLICKVFVWYVCKN